MGRHSRWMGLYALFLLWPLGCSQGPVRNEVAPGVPIVRVRLLQNQDKVLVTATSPAMVKSGSHSTPRRLNFPKGAEVPLMLSASGWQAGNVNLGTGELHFHPTYDGTMSINGKPYRGNYRFVPVAPGRFDVVNDVDIDSYLKSVLPEELLWNWHDETYRAQAIVARTYALYECRVAGAGRHWDVYPDTRSQMYGGIQAESRKSRAAAEATAGVVVAHGKPGREKIFKAYFSSCCGGISQSAADAFGDAYIEPLSDQNVRSLCSASPRFNWGPVAVSKTELTRRFRLWGQRRDRPERNMATVSRVEVQATNHWGRPTRFVITDARGTRYSWTGEEIRWAVNTDAPQGTTLYSSFFKLINEPDTVKFVEGHGWGHGVGMCQWCAQRRAESGMRHEDIVLAAFQRSRLIRAY